MLSIRDVLDVFMVSIPSRGSSLEVKSEPIPVAFLGGRSWNRIHGYILVRVVRAFDHTPTIPCSDIPLHRRFVKVSRVSNAFEHRFPRVYDVDTTYLHRSRELGYTCLTPHRAASEARFTFHSTLPLDLLHPPLFLYDQIVSVPG
ncbi:hypothetical protein VNO77_14821 [Canavalia gladiata]|uniref:Uncharacterized protein n=1 Tax=Canavalia gladiata TaxID=3824 RepID=A0AAN9LZ08_CANGL